MDDKRVFSAVKEDRGLENLATETGAKLRKQGKCCGLIQKNGELSWWRVS
jgi:hypothetical protein